MSNFLINNHDMLQKRLNFLQSLTDMKITTKILEESNHSSINSVDFYYDKLGCDILNIKKNVLDLI